MNPEPVDLAAVREQLEIWRAAAAAAAAAIDQLGPIGSRAMAKYGWSEQKLSDLSRRLTAVVHACEQARDQVDAEQEQPQ